MYTHPIEYIHIFILFCLAHDHFHFKQNIRLQITSTSYTLLNNCQNANTKQISILNEIPHHHHHLLLLCRMNKYIKLHN